MQLALDGLDRLVDALEEQGVLSAVEAARLLFATSSIPEGLACSLLEEVTAGDSRIVSTGATVCPERGAGRPVARGRRVRRLRPRDDRPVCRTRSDLRGRSGPRPGARARRLVPVARESAHCPARAGGPPDRAAPGGAAGGAFGRRLFSSAFSPLPATTCSLRTTLASTSASSSASCCSGMDGAFLSRRSAPQRSLAACSKAGCAVSASPRSPTSSASRRSRATARCPTPRRRPRCSST